jgi:Uma2 family endonuclease
MTVSTTDARFTVEDYLSLPEGFPAQLIDGWLVKEPAPTWRHQKLVLALAMRAAAAAGQDRVLIGPADLALDRWNVLQPDVLVFSREVLAAQASGERPVLVIEVLSPGTAERDRGVKCATYLRAGITEVWLVDPDAGAIEIRTRDGATRHAGEEEAASRVVPGFRVSWGALAT